MGPNPEPVNHLVGMGRDQPEMFDGALERRRALALAGHVDARPDIAGELAVVLVERQRAIADPPIEAVGSTQPTELSVR